MEISKLKPVRTFSIGYFITEQMEFRGLNAQKLSEMIHLNSSDIYDLLDGNKRVTDEIARNLSQAFGQSIQYWKNLDSNNRNHSSL